MYFIFFTLSTNSFQICHPGYLNTHLKSNILLPQLVFLCAPLAPFLLLAISSEGDLQKYAKFAAFSEFMVICVALLMLLNLHLTNGIGPSPIIRLPQIRPVALHLDDEINAASTSFFRHSLSFHIVALCIFVFLAVFQNILVTFCILHFNMRF